MPTIERAPASLREKDAPTAIRHDNYDLRDIYALASDFEQVSRQRDLPAV